MDGDPHQRRYVVRMLATLAAVSLVVVTNNVVVLVLAWGAASVALHVCSPSTPPTGPSRWPSPTRSSCSPAAPTWR